MTAERSVSFESVEFNLFDADLALAEDTGLDIGSAVADALVVFPVSGSE